MRKIIVHTETIKKPKEKIAFQIKLPVTAQKLTGILAAVSPLNLAGAPPPPSIPNPTTPIEGLRTQAGTLQLMLPQKRDTFYADHLFFPNHLLPNFSGVEQLGIGQKPEWWFSGAKRPFFQIKVPIKDTIIEGFYEDTLNEIITNYTLKIYLKFIIH